VKEREEEDEEGTEEEGRTAVDLLLPSVALSAMLVASSSHCAAARVLGMGRSSTQPRVSVAFLAFRLNGSSSQGRKGREEEDREEVVGRGTSSNDEEDMAL
jgi:hypothetical protein